MIVFVHTPKCGGKSFRRSLQASYKERLRLHYVNPRKDHSRMPYLLRPVWPNRKKTDIIYGHFCFDQFALYSLFQPVMKGMLFRNPVDLVCSSYFYRRHKRADEYKNVSLIEYAKRQDVRNIFKLFLGGTRVETLDFVGLQEHYNSSLQLYEKIFNKHLPVHNVNVTQDKPVDYKNHLQSENILEEFTELMKDNMEIYNHAESRFRELISKFDVKLTN